MKTQTVQLEKKHGITKITVGKNYEGRNPKAGAISELYACAYLMTQGYEVFRNVCPFGPVDIIAMKDNEVRFIDVKTIALRRTEVGLKIYGPKLTEYQKSSKVEMLYVTHSGECGFTLEEILETIGDICGEREVD